MVYPFVFQPLFMERIWGGRHLETLYGKALPASQKIGESWEISDRPEAQSVIQNGPLAGTTLHQALHLHETAIMGEARLLKGRFPLLVKILDAREKLSLQVHPPTEKAAVLDGEPKTEMWYVTHAEPGAELYVGLRKGATRSEFESRIRDGTVAECFHRIEMQDADAMFLPSGRVHAIGAGLVLFEIQQNSDSTYRVFDWNRLDAAGKPRQLHVKESLECIDFNDFEPAPIREEKSTSDLTSVRIRPLVENSLFGVEEVTALPSAKVNYTLKSPLIVGVATGEIRLNHRSEPVQLKNGQFALVPAGMRDLEIEPVSAARFLIAQPERESLR
jgi:mannose-6-phosphate isomerase